MTESHGGFYPVTSKKPLALIIEDDPKLATIFAGALGQAEYNTEIVLDGRTALARLADIIPSLILLDIHLPYHSGTELLQQIRTDTRMDQTRVILATADARGADQLHGQADLVLLKPISYVQLRDLAARLRPRMAIDD